MNNYYLTGDKFLYKLGGPISVSYYQYRAYHTIQKWEDLTKHVKKIRSSKNTVYTHPIHYSLSIFYFNLRLKVLNRIEILNNIYVSVHNGWSFVFNAIFYPNVCKAYYFFAPLVEDGQKLGTTFKWTRN